MVTRIGLIGFSENNGHPYSFTTIINGFQAGVLEAIGWGQIEAYMLREADAWSGCSGAQVTHVWGGNPKEIRALRRIDPAILSVSRPEDMIGEIDGVVFARDDWMARNKLVSLFLRAGLPTFVDKPLTLNEAELDDFAPFLKAGSLMSTSGLRYSPELQILREADTGNFSEINFSGPGSWSLYSTHLVDLAIELLGLDIEPVRRTNSGLTAQWGGTKIEFSCSNFQNDPFRIVGHGPNPADIRIEARFEPFRLMLEGFFKMVSTGVPQIDPEATIRSCQLSIAGMK